MKGVNLALSPSLTLLLEPLLLFVRRHLHLAGPVIHKVASVPGRVYLCYSVHIPPQ